MIKRMNKIITMILLLIIIMPNGHVEALSGGYGVGFNDGDNDSNEKLEITIDSAYDASFRRFVCEYVGGAGAERKIDINAYDTEGNSIVPYSKITTAKFKAGTWIGINIREYKRVYWNAQITKNYEIKWQIAFVKSFSREVFENCSSRGSYRSTEWTKCIDEARISCGYKWEDINHLFGPGQAVSTIEYFYGDEELYKNDLSRYKILEDSSGGNCITQIKSFGTVIKENSITPEARKECEYKAVQNTVGAALGSLNPTLKFEIIDPNDYMAPTITYAAKDSSNNVAKLLWNCNIKDETTNIPLKASCVQDSGGNWLITGRTKMPKGIINITKENYNKFWSGDYYATYEYSPPANDSDAIDYTIKTCINVKTSKVCYDCNNDKNCSGDKKNTRKLQSETTEDIYLNSGIVNISINEPVSFWKYFIPFNTPTSNAYSTDKNKFWIRVESQTPSSDEKGNSRECIDVLKNYPIRNTQSILNYTDLIVPIKEIGENKFEYKEFEGNYYGNENASDMQLFTIGNYQCLVSTKLEFNVEQHFYGENEKRTALKGYSFYYRPINPTEPFPNGIAVDSIWLNLYNSEENKITVKKEKSTITKTGTKTKEKEITVSLDKSFDKITYTTKEVSSTEIKNKVSNNSNYTSWENMNLNGTSKFIDELNMRKISKNKCIYPLGCGPDNSGQDSCPSINVGECN